MNLVQKEALLLSVEGTANDLLQTGKYMIERWGTQLVRKLGTNDTDSGVG